MDFHVMTLFPDMIMDGLNTSITGRAIKAGVMSVKAYDIREYSNDKHLKVDDYPYGGGAGMVMRAAPVCDCYEDIVRNIGKRPRVVYMTPQGYTFTQSMAEEFAKEDNLVILCGHYEGIDERVLEEIVTDYVSIGDYVLTGGELPAMVMVDAISRLVPGVLHNNVSAEFESFQDNLLEYPQYSRPEEWHGKKVPPVLMSGHHANIEKWRREQSILRTYERRPDLLEKSNLTEKEKKEVKKLYEALWNEVLRKVSGGSYDVLVMDEFMAAYRYGLIPNEEALCFLEKKPTGLEVVLTGRDPDLRLVEKADYVSEICKVKHPYDRGIRARRGIEY